MSRATIFFLRLWEGKVMAQGGNGRRLGSTAYTLHPSVLLPTTIVPLANTSQRPEAYFREHVLQSHLVPHVTYRETDLSALQCHARYLRKSPMRL